MIYVINQIKRYALLASEARFYDDVKVCYVVIAIIRFDYIYNDNINLLAKQNNTFFSKNTFIFLTKNITISETPKIRQNIKFILTRPHQIISIISEK